MKRARTDKEIREVQQYKKEIEKLKRQNQQLRKQLARIDIDRYENLKEIINKHYDEEERIEKESLLDKLKEEWKCHECKEGYLEIFLYNKLSETWYYRKCSSPGCKNRTKSQRYSKDVKGILKDEKN